MNAYNNQKLMENIRAQIDHLGLLINENGKLVTLWENWIPVETKRYSRATGCTNDHLPGIGPVLLSVGTICLTVAQASESNLEPMTMYAHLGVICLTLLIHHDPAACIGLSKFLSSMSQESIRKWWIKNLFLDPALGGSAGCLSTDF
jgi:hypothetical protein